MPPICKDSDDPLTKSSNASHKQSTTGSTNLGEVCDNDARNGEVYDGQVNMIIRGENNFNHVPTSVFNQASQGIDGTYVATNNNNTSHKQSITSAANWEEARNSDAHGGNIYNGDIYIGQANEIICGKNNFNHVVTSGESDKTSQGVGQCMLITSFLYTDRADDRLPPPLTSIPNNGHDSQPSPGTTPFPYDRITR